MTIIKMILGWIAQIAIPKAIQALAKMPNKYGIATKESFEVYEKVKKYVNNDGLLDADEIKDLTPEIIEAFIALFNVFNKKLQIRIKLKSFK